MTATVSVTAPSSSLIAMVLGVLIARPTLSIVVAENPGAFAVTLYRPGTNWLNEYRPALSLSALRFNAVSRFRISTMAPLTAPPDWSVTVPFKEVKLWPHANPAQRPRKANTRRVDIIYPRNWNLRHGSTEAADTDRMYARLKNCEVVQPLRFEQ